MGIELLERVGERIGIRRKAEPQPTSADILPQLDGLWRSAEPHTAVSFLHKLDEAFAKTPPTSDEKVYLEAFVSEHMTANPEKRSRFLQILRHITPYVSEPLVMDTLRHNEGNYPVETAEGSLGILIQLKSKEAIEYLKGLITSQQKDKLRPYTLGPTYEALANKPDPEAVALLKDGLAYCRAVTPKDYERVHINPVRHSIVLALANNENPKSVDVLLTELALTVNDTLENDFKLDKNDDYLYKVVKALIDWGIPLDDTRYGKLSKLLKHHESAVVNTVARGMLPQQYAHFFTRVDHDEVNRSAFPWAENELEVLRSVIAVFHNRESKDDVRIIEGHLKFAEPRDYFQREVQLYHLAEQAKFETTWQKRSFMTVRPELHGLKGVIQSFQYQY